MAKASIPILERSNERWGGSDSSSYQMAMHGAVESKADGSNSYFQRGKNSSAPDSVQRVARPSARLESRVIGPKLFSTTLLPNAMGSASLRMYSIENRTRELTAE